MQLLVRQRFYVTQQAARGDRHVLGSLTRFIPPVVAACFDTVCAAEVAMAAQAAACTREPAASPAQSGSSVGQADIAARVRSIRR